MKGIASDKTFINIFKSYIIVLIIPLVFGIIISSFIAKALYHELVELGNYSTYLVQSETDNTLGLILSDASQLASHSTLRQTIFFDDEKKYDPSTKIMINSMSKEILAVSNDYIENIYIYYQVSNSVISYDGRLGGSSVSWYLEKELNLTENDLMDHARQLPTGGILLNKSKNNPYLIAICPVFGRNSYNIGGAVCIKIDTKLITHGLKEFEFSDGEIFITDGDAYFGSSGKSGYNFQDLKAGVAKTMYTYGLNSKYPNIEYRLAIPTSTFFNPFYKSVLITVVYAVFCLISGIAIVLLISYKRYRILGSFMKLTSSTTPKDAITAIERTLKQVTQHKFSNGNYQVKINQLKREKHFERLFTSVPHPKHAISSLGEYGIVFPYEFYTVAVIDNVMDYSGLFAEEGINIDEDELYMHATTILRAVYEELFSEYAKAYVTTVSSCRICIINFDTDGGRIDRTLAEAAEFCKTNFGMELICCRGQTVSSLSRIKESLKTAMSEAFNENFQDSRENDNSHISERIKDYICENFSNINLDISLIADEFQLSTSYVSRIFKQSTGHTILEYISYCRIAEAKQLLCETNLSIRAISEKVGYSSTRTFTRTMQRLEEISPSEYRSFHKIN